jgi:hypothetical protein
MEKFHVGPQHGHYANKINFQNNYDDSTIWNFSSV